MITKMMSNNVKRKYGLMLFLTFIFNLYFGLQFISSRLHNTTQTHLKEINEQRTWKGKRKVVFIVGQGRTGSSLLAEMFNQHDEFIYFFEPLRAIEHSMNFANFQNRDPTRRDFYQKEVKEFLKDIMNCQYRKQHDKYLSLLDKGSFRYNSRKLTAPPFCEGVRRNCHRINATLMNELCTNNNTLKIAIKELSFRLPNKEIRYLESLASYGKMYLINIVRDPRAYLHSMKRLGWYFDNHKEYARREEFYLAERCVETKRNIEFGIQTLQTHSIRYTILRYEDLSRTNITQLGNGLSRLLKLNLLDHAISYFADKTHGKNNNGDPYSTNSRNIVKAINNWRNKVNFAFVRKVQYTCDDVMRLLGYVIITDEAMLRNASTITFQKFPLKKLDVFSTSS